MAVLVLAGKLVSQRNGVKDVTNTPTIRGRENAESAMFAVADDDSSQRDNHLSLKIPNYTTWFLKLQGVLVNKIENCLFIFV